jgi:hypothetical protein
VFSNGIIGLAVASTALVIVFQADVHKLIPLYAIGVFTSFTLSQAGMAKRHLRLHEPGWRHGLLINGLGAVTTAVVTVVIAITKFADGAWAVMLFVPAMVWVLVRMNHLYSREHASWTTGSRRSSGATTAPPAPHRRGSRSQDHAPSSTRRRSARHHVRPARRGRSDEGELCGRWSGSGSCSTRVLRAAGHATTIAACRPFRRRGRHRDRPDPPGWALRRLRRGRTGARPHALASNPRA